MAHRYHMALARGADVYEAAVKEDEALLKQLGLRLLSVQGGISAAVESEVKKGRVQPWNVVEISAKTWEHLRPALVELIELRERKELLKG